MTADSPDGGWGWVIVTAVTISNLALLPIQQCFGLVFEEQFSKLGITATQTAFILHLNATVMCSLGLINGPLLKKFTFRTVAYMGTSFIFFGICLAAFSQSLETITVAYCVLIAIGQGMMYPAISLALSTYFVEKRSVAMGITITLTGLGPILMPQLIAKLLESYSTTGTVLILGAIALHSYIGASLLRPFVSSKILDVEQSEVSEKKKKTTENNEVVESVGNDEEDEEREKNIDRILTEEIKLLSKNQSQQNKNFDVETAAVEENFVNDKNENKTERRKNVFSKIASSLDLDLLRDNHFRIIILGMGVTLVSELNFASMTPFVLAELAGLTSSKIATTMSIQATADITGRLCVPLVAQKFGWSSQNLYLASILGSTIGRSILASWSSSYTVIVAVSILLGISKGTKAVFQALVIPDNVPLDKLPAASGLLMVSNGILSMALGPLIGLVHDKTDGYVMALHFTSGLSLFCVVLWIGERVYRRRQSGTTKAEIILKNDNKNSEIEN